MCLCAVNVSSDCFVRTTLDDRGIFSYTYFKVIYFDIFFVSNSYDEAGVFLFLLHQLSCTDNVETHSYSPLIVSVIFIASFVLHKFFFCYLSNTEW